MSHINLNIVLEYGDKTIYITGGTKILQNILLLVKAWDLITLANQHFFLFIFYIYIYFFTSYFFIQLASNFHFPVLSSIFQPQPLNFKRFSSWLNFFQSHFKKNICSIYA